MKSIAFLTNYTEYQKSFSPIIIANDQIHMFLKYGYKPLVIASDGFIPRDYFAKCDIKYLPSVEKSDSYKNDANFDSDIKMLADKMKEYLKDVDVVISHDLIYLPDYTKYNLAARMVAEKLPKLRWLHFIHSATPPDIIGRAREIYGDKYFEIVGKPFPNSFIAFPNVYDIPRVAKNFGFGESDVKHIPHPIDYCEYNKFHDISKQLVEKYDLLSADVICCFPLRMDRGKQPHINMEIMAEVKDLGKSVRMIYLDFHSTGDDKAAYREEIKNNAIERGLSSSEVIFSSELSSETRTECPREVVSDMFQLSNIFILPSRSETFSLVAMEAALKGNLLIINHDFPPLRSIYRDMAIYKRFSSDYDIAVEPQDANGQTNVSYAHSSRGYFGDIAKTILFHLEDNKVLKAKTEFRQKNNLDYIFRNYLDPIVNYE